MKPPSWGADAGGRRPRPGSQTAAKISELRAAMYRAVSPDDVEAIIRSMVGLARRGNVTAQRNILNRVLGKPVEVDLIERLEALEGVLERSNSRMLP